MSFAYTNVADAVQHLSSTVIMYDGRPAWVDSIQDTGNAEFVARLQFLPRMRADIDVNIRDPLFMPRSVRLGYTNVNTGHALYLSRVPARQYKQGVCRANLFVPTVAGRKIVNFEGLLGMPEWCDALRGIYPSYEAALDLLKNGRTRAGDPYQSVAFDREFAVQHDDLGFIQLLHRGNPVAFGEGGSFRLPNQFKYLKEQIEEKGLTVNG